jgi:hypothetical protein
MSRTMAMSSHEYINGFLSRGISFACRVADVNGIFGGFYARRMSVIPWILRDQSYLLSKTPTWRPTVTA